MVSAYALGYALFALVAGPLSDGRDRRGVLLAGLSEFIVTTVLRGFAQGLWTMILYRFLAGVSAARLPADLGVHPGPGAAGADRADHGLRHGGPVHRAVRGHVAGPWRTPHDGPVPGRRRRSGRRAPSPCSNVVTMDNVPGTPTGERGTDRHRRGGRACAPRSTTRTGTRSLWTRCCTP
ncbi:MFS transporter [Streptomyces thermodiastaticus]